MELHGNGDAPLQVRPRADFPTNRGGLCRKGWTAAALLQGDRLTTPLTRTRPGGELEPVSWDVALDRVAAGIRRIQAEHGRDAIGVFGGGGLTNEKAYALGKFARVALRTRSIDYNGRFCMSSAAAAAQRAFGLDRGLPFPLPDIAGTDVLLLVGSNLAETMPPAVQWLAEQQRQGGKLVVVDPRRTPTAAQADLHLQPVPGTDLALAVGLLHLVVAAGAVDESYVAERTAGFDEVRRVAAAWWPERVERVTGVPVALLRQAADLLVGAGTAMVLTARGTEQHSSGTDMVLGWINLALALGLPGRPFCGFGTITGQGNGQGGREHGQKADQLPGYRRLADPADRAHVAAVWGIDPDELPQPGPSAYELLDSLGDAVRVLLVAGSNPVVSAPRATHVQQRLSSLDLLVVLDVVRSETAELADVVLPVTQWAEESGTMTNLEGRVLVRRQAVAPPPGVRSDLEVISELAARLGVTQGFPPEPQQVFAELRRATAGGPADYAGITWERIEAEHGVFWPCPTEDHPGTPRLFAERFATPDGRARCHPVEPRPPAERPDDEFPLWLTTGRVAAHYQSGAQTRRVTELRDAAPGPFVEMHPVLAESLGVDEGEAVLLTSRRGCATLPARVVDSIRPDTVFAPFHWPAAGRANNLTDPSLDPASRMPAFKVCAVRLQRAPA
jgi:assimilatory nitrate reductase catalytic subunit